MVRVVPTPSVMLSSLYGSSSPPRVKDSDYSPKPPRRKLRVSKPKRTPTLTEFTPKKFEGTTPL